MFNLSNYNKFVSFVLSLAEVFTLHFYCVCMNQMAVLFQFID